LNYELILLPKSIKIKVIKV